MIVGVVGSRNYKNFEALEANLIRISITKIVSGGADGADSLAKLYAEYNNVPILEHLPDYEKHHPKTAPIIRNKYIVRDSDIIIAFWDGKSRGTLSTITEAYRKGKPVKIIGMDGERMLAEERKLYLQNHSGAKAHKK